MRTVLILVLVLTLFGYGVADSKNINKLVLLKPESCTNLNTDQISKLPESWKKYDEFIKSCSLCSDGTINIISIWIIDYYNTKFKDATSQKWEEFPLPLIVDANFNVIGELPEHYPYDPPRELDVFYYKNINHPGEIHVKVYNPAVSGDYSYPPLIWNTKLQRYK